MKVTTVTKHFFPSVSELFSRSGAEAEILPKDYMKTGYSTDLLVFTGGEDVNPELYGSSYKTFFTEERDAWEYEVLMNLSHKRFHVTRVLGICRGLQMLNVFFGGTLVTDISEHFGMEHPDVHDLEDVASRNGIENPFSGILKVNSLHHQGIGRAGRGMTTLSVEPRTRLPEIVNWGPNNLGVQFHPEFFSESNEYKWEIADIISQWVSGKEFFGTQKRQNTEKYVVDFDAQKKNIFMSDAARNIARFAEAIQAAEVETTRIDTDWINISEQDEEE